MNWEKFKLVLENKTNLKISLKSTDDIDDAENLTKSIQETAWSSSVVLISILTESISYSHLPDYFPPPAPT